MDEVQKLTNPRRLLVKRVLAVVMAVFAFGVVAASAADSSKVNGLREEVH